MKKILSMLLAVMMLVGSLPVSLAEDVPAAETQAAFAGTLSIEQTPNDVVIGDTVRLKANVKNANLDYSLKGQLLIRIPSRRKRKRPTSSALF